MGDAAVHLWKYLFKLYTYGRAVNCFYISCLRIQHTAGLGRYVSPYVFDIVRTIQFGGNMGILEVQIEPRIEIYINFIDNRMLVQIIYVDK